MTEEADIKYDWAGERGDKWQSQLSGLEAMLSILDEPLIEALQLDQPYRIADIGCGGGATSIAIAKTAPAGSKVHGYDISPSLIDSARAEAGDIDVSFEVADMQVAKPAGKLYHRLSSRLGVMFFEDEDAAFSNLSHWLAPGGSFAFAVWAAPANNHWIMIIKNVVEEFIEMPPTDPDTPGPFRYADPDKLTALLERSGFDKVQIQAWRGLLPIGGGLPADQAARFALEAFSIGELLDEAGPDIGRTGTAKINRAIFTIRTIRDCSYTGARAYCYGDPDNSLNHSLLRLIITNKNKGLRCKTTLTPLPKRN